MFATTDTSDETRRLLVDAAASFAVPDGARLRALRGFEAGYDRAVLRQMAELGWLSILVPESAGGLGLGVADAVVIARRLGYACYREPFVAVGVLAARCLADGGSDAALALLDELMSGERVVGVAWQAPDGVLQPEAGGVAVVRDAGTQRLDGEARFAAAADADSYIVEARDGQGGALVRVDANAPGLSVQMERCADDTALARLRFDGVAVSDQNLLVGAETGARRLQQALDAALVATSAELVGLAERATEMTLEYMRQRKQFGRAIGSFQALQHRAVDMWVHCRVAHAAVAAAANVLDDASATAAARARAASGAKMRAAQTAERVMREAVQLHGAIGTTEEYDLSLYTNRALVLAAWLGNAPRHRLRYDMYREGNIDG